MHLNKFSSFSRLFFIQKRCATTKAVRETFLQRISTGPGLQEFFTATKLPPQVENNVPYLELKDFSGHGRKVFFEVYGCQMNNNDTEVVWSILQANNYERSNDIKYADVILLMTCAIRENAEQKIWHRLKHLQAMKEKRATRKGPLQVTLLGCMAERLKERLIEQDRCVDVIAGPDSYKDLPRLLAVSRHYKQSAINVLLSLDETYADVLPVRLNVNSPSAYVSIMRGCDNMCSYCIVPFTRGRERSRDLESIKNEVSQLRDQGVKEVTLLGQNVNSYRYLKTHSENTQQANTEIAAGFKTVYKPKLGGLRFSHLLKTIAETVPDMRIRFTSPHPKDFAEDVLRVIRDYPNVCKNLHLPAQSGNDQVLERMRRGYTRIAYLKLVDRIKELIPKVGLSSDFICGFCGETEEEFQDTLTLIEQVRYNMAFLFAYSMRERTTAHRRYLDDVPQKEKIQRLKRMVEVFRKGATELQQQFVGRHELILIEDRSKRSENYWFGRNDSNIKVIVPACSLNEANGTEKPLEVGDFVAVHIDAANSQVLQGTALHYSSISEFYANK